MVDRAIAIALAGSLALTPSLALAGPPEPSEAPGAQDPAADGEASDAKQPEQPEQPEEPEEPEEPEQPEQPEADPDTEAAARAYREGSDLYELGKYAEAATKFGEAWELTHKAPLLYNMGQAHWKWFDIDPDIEHLRQARLFFTNYDKRMRLVEGYDSAEIAGYIRQIEQQIIEQEKKIEEANRPVIIQSAALTEEEVQQAQRRRTTRALNISGTVLIVTGAVTLGLGIGGLVSRAVFGAVLDTTSGEGGAQVNLATAEEDKRRRDGYRTSGQIAFGALIAGVIVLPIGITLRAIGAARHKKDGAAADEDEKKKKRRGKQARARLAPGPTGVVVRF